MYCNKCGNEIPDGSVFCNKCGIKIVTDTSNDVLSRLKKLNNKLLVFGLVGVLIIGAIIATVIFFNNPVGKFKEAIKDNKYIEASKIYNEKIKGNTSDENEIINFLKSNIESIKKDFSENKLEYNAAISQLDIIEKTGLVLSEVLSAKSEINSLNDSRTAFKKGKEFLDSKNYKEALSELKKVISEDENYSKAQELINSCIKDYKTTVLSEAKTAANSNDYDNALALLNEALTLIPNDSDISTKKASYEKLNEEKKAAERNEKNEELKNNQEVIDKEVTGDSKTKTASVNEKIASQPIPKSTSKPTNKSICPLSIAFIPAKPELGLVDKIEPHIYLNSIGTPTLNLPVMNKSGKDIDAFEFTCKLYDAFGEPAYKIGTKSNVFKGIAQGILLPAKGGNTYGEEYPWEYYEWNLVLYETAIKVDEIKITRVHFTDNTSWPE